MTDNKAQPEQAKGTVNIPSQPKINIDIDAVVNNKSEVTSEEFIKSIRKAAKEELFSPSPSPGPNDEENNGK